MASQLVLLVDDDDLSLEIAALQLSVSGHETWKASSGAEALTLLRNAIESPSSPRLPGIILTDLQMPDMDGVTLCRRIRSLCPHVPRIIAMSATRPADDRLRGFDDFLQKPLELESLEKVLRRDRFQPASAVVAIPEAPLDPIVLQKLRVLMPPAALDELLSTYLKDTRIRLAEMERFSELGDDEALRRCAHMIKGSAAMAGATKVSRLAAQIESGTLPPEQRKTSLRELRCACDAIEGTLAQSTPGQSRDLRRKEAHDHEISRIG